MGRCPVMASVRPGWSTYWPAIAPLREKTPPWPTTQLRRAAGCGAAQRRRLEQGHAQVPPARFVPCPNDPPVVAGWASALRPDFGPGMYAQVRFGQQTVAVTPPGPEGRAENHRQLRHGLQPDRPRVPGEANKVVGVGQPDCVALAVVEVGGEMQTLHGWHCSASPCGGA